MFELYGNTTGLSSKAIDALEKIYKRRVPMDCLATPELMKSLAQASFETRRQVGVLVHRSGVIDYVIVGDSNQLMLPDVGRLRAAQGRFRGLRLIHTHVRGETLNEDDLIDLVRLRLDLVAVLTLSVAGGPKGLVWAHNVPTSSNKEELPYRVYPMIPLHDPSRLEVDLKNVMENLEAEFSKRAKTRDVRAKDGRAILVHVASSTRKEGSRSQLLQQAEASLAELCELARTAGVEVADTFIQIKDKLDSRYVMGKGKLSEIILRAIDLDAEILVFDHNLSPTQAAAISAQSDLKVIDRTQLILDIFAQRAESSDGKLQVELAQLKYSLPRLQQKDDALSRLTGGIGGRGPGETKIEIGRRRAKERVNHLELQLSKLVKQREERRKKRVKKGEYRVAIVGYTNAGKSTLLGMMTKSSIFTEDKLFATLDTRSRNMDLAAYGLGEAHFKKRIICTDTVGFIRNLPKNLFAAFKATFEEIEDADVLLNVVDASDPNREKQLLATENILKELCLDSIPRILVWNKIECMDSFEAKLLIKKYGSNHQLCVPVSALDKASVSQLVLKLASYISDTTKKNGEE